MREQEYEGELGEDGEQKPPEAGLFFEADADAEAQKEDGGLGEGASGALPGEKDGGGGKVGERTREIGAEDAEGGPEQEHGRGFVAGKGEIEHGHARRERREGGDGAHGGETEGKSGA